MSIPFLSDIILQKGTKIQFKTDAGANAGTIDTDSNGNLVFNNTAGDILLGDGSSDVYIGDGTNNVDIIFEQSGAIKGDGSAVTLTLGGSNTTLNLENPNFNGAVTMNSKLTFGTTNGFILFDYEPSGDTGEYATEVPLIKVDRSGEESTILARISEYRGIALGIDDTTWIRAGDTSSVIRSNVNLAAEQVLMSAEGGFIAYGFPGNDTTWSNRVEFQFRSDSTTASDNGLYIGDGGRTQFIDLSRNLKNIGTITASGKISGGEIEGTSLDINGNADISGDLTGVDHITASGTVTANQLNLDTIGDYITFYGGGETNHSITSRQLDGGTGDDIRVNTYGSFIVNLDSNNNQSTAANSSFFVGRHGSNASSISGTNLLFQIDGQTGDVLPGSDNTHDLGSSAKRWQNVVAVNLHGDGSNITNLPAQSAPSNMVTTDTSQTISGAKTFTSNSNQFNGHVYFNAYDSQGNHYPHFRDGSASNGANINIRQYYGSSNYKTHVMSSDSSGSMQFDFQGTLKGDALTIDGGVDINGSADISGTLGTGRVTITSNSDNILNLNQTSSDNKWNYINFQNQGTRDWFIGQDNDGNFDLYNDNINAYAITVNLSNNSILLNDTVTVAQALTITSGDVTLSAGNIIVGSQYGIRFNDANTRIYTNTDTPEDLIIEADQDLLLTPDGQVNITGTLSISGDGSNAVTLTESGSGDFTIDAADDIRLDAGGGDIVLRDDGSEYARLTNDSQTLEIKVSTNDRDIKFNGYDNNTEITALKLDMSQAGEGVFHNNIRVPGEITQAGSTTFSIDLKDHSNYTWLRNEPGQWSFQSGTTGDDWTQSWQIYVPNVGSDGGNATFVELGQRHTNDTTGEFKGVKIVKRTGSGVVDGDFQAGATTVSDLTVTGNLSITGDIDSYNVNNLDVVDKLITVGKGQSEANSNGSGILVDGSNASLLWDESNNTWDFNKSLDVVGNINASGNITVGGTVDGVDIAALAAANTGDQDLSGLVTKASAQTISGAKTFSTSLNVAELITSDHIYGRAVNNSFSHLYRFGGLFLTWDSDSYGTNFHHSITSTDNGTYSDSITINSFDKVRINIDSNDNDSASTFTIGKHTTGTANTLLTLDQDGDLTITGTVTANGTTLTGDQDLSGYMPKSGGTFTGTVTGTQFKLNNNVTNTNADSFFVYTDGGSTTYGMTLWNTSGTSGEWATMIYGPNQSNRRISFGKANANFGTSHAGIDELAWLDLDNGNYFTDGNIYPSEQTTHYVSSGRIQNWQTAYTTANNALPKSGGTMTGDLVMQDEMINFSGGNPELPQFRGKRSNTDLNDRDWDTEGGWSYTTFENNTTNKPSAGLHNANGLLTFNTHSGDGTNNYMHQIAMTTNTNKLWHRHRNGASWGSWEEIRKGNITFASLTSKPTTLAGYGITDAAAASHNHDSRYLRKDAETQGTQLNLGGEISSGSSAKLQVYGFQRTGPIMIAQGNTSATSWDTTNEKWLMNNSGNLYIGNGTDYSDRIFHDSYHPNADKWTTARTITLGGDLSGSVSIDGSANVTLSAQVTNNSHTHDDRYYTETESDARYLRSDYNENFTRVGYGNSGNVRYHKLVTITVDSTYDDYNATFEWTGRYSQGIAGIHVHSDNDTTADVMGAWYVDWNPVQKLASQGWIKYTQSGDTVEVWVKTNGWREFDYIIKDSVTEGTPSVTWYTEDTTTDQATEPSNLNAFSNNNHFDAGYASSSHNHAAGDITSGTFATARIPNLAASKITSGTFANARISESSVTQHVTGISSAQSQKLAYITVTQAVDLDDIEMKAALGNSAYGWGDHSVEGYLTSLPSHNHDDRYYTETEIDNFGFLTSSSTQSKYLRSDTADTAGGNITFSDNVELILGTGSDFRMEHNGSNTIFRNYNHGNTVYFQSENSSGTNQNCIIWGGAGGYAELRYNNASRITTTSAGWESNGAVSLNNKLELTYSATAGSQFEQPSTGVTTYRVNSDRFRIWMGNGSSETFTVAETGRVGINDSTPDYTLDVSGNVSNTSIYASHDIVAYSDIRVKDEIETITDALEKVNKLRGVTFVRTDEGSSDKRMMGVIAQEVEEVIPEVVTTKDSDGHKAVAYGNMVGVLIEAVKELTAEVEELKKLKCKCDGCTK